ncbi:MAG: hypothetical protein JWN00_7 [Actinomycetia bacterium]|nr:hypothetical protein [Actinomycetes bacterium]
MTQPPEPARPTTFAALRTADGTFNAQSPTAAVALPPLGPVQELPPDPATVLNRLRRDFPRWGILYDGRATWTAIYGRLAPIRSRTALGLRAALDTVTAPTTGPGTTHHR